MDNIRITPDQVGKWNSPEQKEAYQKAMHLKEQADGLTRDMVSIDGASQDKDGRPGRVKKEGEMGEASYKATLNFDKTSGEIKKMKAEVDDPESRRIFQLEAKHHKGILGGEKQTYEYKETDLTCGEYTQKLTIDKNGVMDYSEFKFHAPGAGYRPIVGEFPPI